MSMTKRSGKTNGEVKVFSLTWVTDHLFFHFHFRNGVYNKWIQWFNNLNNTLFPLYRRNALRDAFQSTWKIVTRKFSYTLLFMRHSQAITLECFKDDITDSQISNGKLQILNTRLIRYFYLLNMSYSSYILLLEMFLTRSKCLDCM